jgi:hypothetical protein
VRIGAAYGITTDLQYPCLIQPNLLESRDPDLESKYNSTALANLYTEIRLAVHEPIWLKLIRPKSHNIPLSNMFVKPYGV